MAVVAVVAPGRVYFDDVTVFQIASFSPSTLKNSVFKKHLFQIAPLWIAFSNGSVFGDHFRRCSVNDSRIRSKTAPFSFENGLVWMGPYYLIVALVHFSGISSEFGRAMVLIQNSHGETKRP